MSSTAAAKPGHRAPARSHGSEEEGEGGGRHPILLRSHGQEEVPQSEDEPEEPEIFKKCLRAPGQLYYGDVKDRSL